jgi:hypothetical protein
MLLKQARFAIPLAALLAVTTAPTLASNSFTVAATVNTIATVNMSTPAYTFTSVDNASPHLAANENALIPPGGNITGSIRTSKAGTGIISIAAPSGPIIGIGGATLAVSLLQATCTVGTSNSGVNAIPTGLASQTALVPSSSVQCAKYNAAGLGTSAAVGLVMTLFLDDTQVVADTYAALNGFSVTASAT